MTHSVSGYGDVTTARNVIVNVRDDDERPRVIVSRTSLIIDEGGSDTYTVRLSTDPGGTATVTVNDPTDNSNVTADPESLTFDSNDWQTEQTVTVSAAQDDDNVDDSATVTHSVSGYGSVTTAADVSVSVRDDEAPSVEVSFQRDSYTVTEGESETVRVILSANPRQTVAIPINTTNLNGASDDDYSGVPSEITFSNGETQMSFTFSATQDILNDDGESVRLTFGALPPNVSAGAISQATIEIDDDDGPGVMISPTSLTIDENDSGRYGVVLEIQPSASVTVSITAPVGSDVSTNESSLTFTTGNWDVEQFVTVSAADDTDDADDTAVIMHSASGASEYAGIAVDSVTVTVADDDSQQPEVTIMRVSSPITEGGNAVFRLSRTGPTMRSLSVNVDVSQSGDFAEASDLGASSWTISSGDSSSRVVVATVDDSVDEQNGTITATLNAGAGYDVGSPSVATVTVEDNDEPSGQTPDLTPQPDHTPTPTVTVTPTPTPDMRRGDGPTPTRTPKPTATPVPIEKVEVTPVPGATTIQPDESEELKSGGAILSIPYISRARTYQVIFTETDTCQDMALGSVKAWVYTAEGEREYEVWSIHPLEISFTLSKSQVEDLGGLGVLFQAYALGGVTIQGSDRLPGRWNDIRPTFFDVNPDGGVTAYAMTRYFSSTFCLNADPALLESARQQIDTARGIFTATATATATATVTSTPTPTVTPTPIVAPAAPTAAANHRDTSLPVPGDGSSSTSLILALIAAAIFMSLLVTISITDRARPGR